MGDDRQSDLRGARRVDVQLQVKLRFADVERFRLFTTKDLSTGGIFVVTPTPKPVGSTVQVVLYPPGIELGLPIYGTIVHALDDVQAALANTRPGMGIRFDDLDEEARASLARLMEHVGDAIEGKPLQLEPDLAGLLGEPEELPIEDLIEEEGATPATVARAEPPAAQLVAPIAAPVTPRPKSQGPHVPPPPTLAFSPTGDERRASERVTARAPVRLRFPNAGDFREFYTKDVSRGGVFLCASPPLPVGSDVELLLSLPSGEELSLEGRVARAIHAGPGVSADNAGMGIEFTNLTLEKRAEINRHVDELAGRPAAEMLGRVKVVSTAVVRFDVPAEFQRIVRGDLRHRRIFVAADEPRPVGTSLVVNLQAPQLPNGIALQGEVQRVVERGEAGAGQRPGMVVKLLDLTDELLADLDLRTRPEPTVSAVAAAKAAKLADAASEDLASGRRASAVANLKLALSFDPHNEGYRKLLDDLVAKAPAGKGGAAKR